MGSPPTINRAGGLIRNTEKLFKLWYCSFVHFYNSKVSHEGREKKNRWFPPEKLSFRFSVWLGENQNCGGTGSFQLGIGQFPPFWPIQFVVLYGNGVPKKSRAQKMSGGTAGGHIRQVYSEVIELLSVKAPRRTRTATKRTRQRRGSEGLTPDGINFLKKVEFFC